jgi:hypothetical protein
MLTHCKISNNDHCNNNECPEKTDPHGFVGIIRSAVCFMHKLRLLSVYVTNYTLIDDRME